MPQHIETRYRTVKIFERMPRCFILANLRTIYNGTITNNRTAFTLRADNATIKSSVSAVIATKNIIVIRNGNVNIKIIDCSSQMRCNKASSTA